MNRRLVDYVVLSRVEMVFYALGIPDIEDGTATARKDHFRCHAYALIYSRQIQIRLAWPSAVPTDPVDCDRSRTISLAARETRKVAAQLAVSS